MTWDGAFQYTPSRIHGRVASAESLKSVTERPLQLFSVAVQRRLADTLVARKDKLIAKLRSKPKDFTWGEACTVMKACGFELHNRDGSRRMFKHSATKRKVIMHEPHSRPALLPYEIDLLIDGLKEVGEISE